jgi:hypothetical protein
MSIPLQVEQVWDDKVPFIAEFESQELPGDAENMVESPKHYVSSDGLEAIDVIESFDLNFNLGNAVKYILRSGKKWNREEDLLKALWYINREIQQANK